MHRAELKFVAEVLQTLESFAPLGTAEAWDNVGLILGDPEQQTRGVVLSLDLTLEALKVAQQKNYSLIITHHPCLFPKDSKCSRILAGSPLDYAMRHGIAVASYHTNFDRCALEVVDEVAKGLQVVPQGRLVSSEDVWMMKLVTFIPTGHVDSVREALFRVGVGHLGNYDCCSFEVLGTGTFRGNESTKPMIGQPGFLEKVSEARLEFVFPRGYEQVVVQALLAAHPYEEVAYDLYSLQQSPAHKGLIRGLGYGFWGHLKVPQTFAHFLKQVHAVFETSGLWMTQPVPELVQRVAFAPGKATSLLSTAQALRCDLILTGEVGYHAAFQSRNRGMGVMEIGHLESEKFFVPVMRNWLSCTGLPIWEVKTPTQRFYAGGFL